VKLAHIVLTGYLVHIVFPLQGLSLGQVLAVEQGVVHEQAVLLGHIAVAVVVPAPDLVLEQVAMCSQVVVPEQVAFHKPAVH
jgi:hypothetical protein